MGLPFIGCALLFLWVGRPSRWGRSSRCRFGRSSCCGLSSRRGLSADFDRRSSVALAFSAGLPLNLPPPFRAFSGPKGLPAGLPSFRYPRLAFPDGRDALRGGRLSAPPSSLLTGDQPAASFALDGLVIAQAALGPFPICLLCVAALTLASILACSCHCPARHAAVVRVCGGWLCPKIGDWLS